MEVKKISRHALFLVIFVLGLNMLAMKFYWYYSIWHFDMLMHFLGGFFIGLMAFYLFVSRNFSVSLAKILFFVFLVGAGWEIFEILVNVFITGHLFNLADSVSDIFFDLAGGVSALLYYGNIKSNENRG